MTNVTITGLGGAQQAAIADAFRGAGWQVTGTRRTGGDGALAADLETGAGLAQAFAGRDAVVFTVPQDHRPGVAHAMTDSVLNAAAAEGVGRIVVNMAGRVDDTSPAPIFADYRAIRDRVLGGPVPAVVLEPTIYMDNLLAPWTLPHIQAGTLAYPAPADVRIAWVSHRSLAQAVVGAATAAVTGRRVKIGGPEALTGTELAALLAARLGRPVGYAAIPLDAFAAGLNAAFGPPAGDRIADLYRVLSDRPDAMADGQAGMAELGVAPETFEDFAARQTWA